MNGHPQIIALLNDVLTAELTAVNQYWLHARIVENWGYARLWKKIRDESIGEMKHADRLVARVLFLGGLPNLQRLGKVNVGESVAEMFRLDLQVELDSVKSLNDGIALCRSVNDNGSRELLERILVDSEEHVDWIEGQLELMKQLGEANYLAQQVKDEG
ncbi:bacterioferritin [Aggregicoccus sp. 17bor-14]|uniref:bacterioferritin n=1 Tax=Myxococcaceae TaxID=31 RepID=UPI00129C9BFE|nr:MULTISPECIES: bacterioferritin [Myxococcaceae]MBF5046473.1 bacterioferritin [Simulacricoccus sp. 17bor-14]MRI92190.1 bacterioferritin [Aggregicoccus sp. 17bor-14]